MSTTDEPKPGSPRYWGPLLWRTYHLLAELPIDPTRMQIWKHILSSTARAMPCEKCRIHLSQYLETNPLVDDVRKYMWNLHNRVNIRNESPSFLYEELTTYEIKERKQTLLEIQQLFTSIEEIWRSLSHTINYPTAFNEWKKYIFLLIKHIKEKHKL
jgi:hypothetical protein